MVEDRGMILHLVYPLADQQGKVQALLSAGVLMNGNATLVDQIKATVYSDLSLAYDSVGTVTIFLQDVRISTNVPALKKPEDRALGSRVSEQVREKVLVQGKRWIDRAFVVKRLVYFRLLADYRCLQPAHWDDLCRFFRSAF